MGVPRPSVFVVLTLLTGVKLQLLEEEFEGARPRRAGRQRVGEAGAH